MIFSRDSRRDVLIAAIVCACAGLALFGYMFGFDLPLASAPFWVMPKGDMAVMTAGYETLLGKPWNLLNPLVTDRLTPTPISIVFTDSIPWIALALKASGLGAVFNPLGVFLLISYLLQGVSMVLLLRAMGVRGLAPLLLGGLFALMTPAWITRQFGHTALSGHFILLLALALAVSIARKGLTVRRAAAFAGLAAFATGVHAYHLLPVAAALAAALLSILLQRGIGALPGVIAAGLASATAVGLSAAWLGYGVGHQASGGADALGFYSMNLLGPIKPQASALFGQTWVNGWFTGAYDATGGQAFEGFNYQGAGILCALVMAAALLAIALVRGERPSREQVLRFAPFALAALALTIIALGPTVYMLDRLVAQFPKPSGKLADMLGMFRAHGRFFWAAGYLAAAVALAVIARRMPRRLLPVVCITLAALQFYDTMPPRQGVRDIFSAPDRRAFPDSLAQAAQIRGRPWIFNPTYYCLMNWKDITTLSQLSLVAIRTGGSVNSSATARSSGDDCGYPADLLHDAAPSDQRITVVFNAGEEQGGRLEPFANRSDCRRFSRGVLCGRDLAGTGLPPVSGRELRPPARRFAEIRFEGPRSPVLASGWTDLRPGDQGVWSNGHVAFLDLPTPSDIRSGDVMLVRLKLRGYSHTTPPVQPVRISADGRALRSVDIQVNGFAVYGFKIPGDMVAPGRPLRVRLDLPEARLAVGDARVLGVAIQEMTIDY